MAAEPGYDCEFVDGPPKELHSECSVCLLVLRQPFLVDCCGHHFCKACLEAVCRERKVCPLCKHEPFTAIPNKGLERVLSMRDVFCTNKKLGCDWTGELRQLESHLNDKFTSDSSGSAAIVDQKPPSAGLPDRVLNGCAFVQVPCCYCSLSFRRDQLKKHLSECPKRPILCKHCKKHTATSQDMVEKHFPVCIKFPVSCPNKCGTKLLRKNVAKHIENTCPNAEVMCKYSNVGCTYVATRKKIDNHLRTTMSNHLSLMDKAYAAQKETESASMKEIVRLQDEIKELKVQHKAECDSLARNHDELVDEYFSQKNLIRKLKFDLRHVQQLQATGADASFSDTSTSKRVYSCSTHAPSRSYSYSGYSATPPSTLPSRTLAKPEEKRRTKYDEEEEKSGGGGWKTALGLAAAAVGVVGLSVAGAAALSSMSSSRKDDDEDDD